jgi:hypothetical protein
VSSSDSDSSDSDSDVVAFEDPAVDTAADNHKAFEHKQPVSHLGVWVWYVWIWDVGMVMFMTFTI